MRSTVTRHLRRSSATAAIMLALGAPLLASCGFDAATTRINTIAAGVNDRSGNVDILGAVIVANGQGTGLFEATFSNNTTLGQVETTASSTPSASSVSVSDGTAKPQTLAPGADQLIGLSGGSADLVATEPISPKLVIPPAGAVNTYSAGIGIPVQGSFLTGSFVKIDLTFASGQRSELLVPVVRPCFEYADIVATPSATPGATDTGVGGADADTDALSCDAETRSTPTDAGSDGN